jgi:superfamily II DNA or RNA helicase
MSLLPSLFFVVDVAHAHQLSEVLRGNGIKVYPVSGQTPDNEEQKFYRLFEEGAIDGLASCGVLQEGFDAPKAMGAFLCRPTKSGLLYRQMIGRVLRPYPAPTGDRPYQSECLDEIAANLQQGVRRQLAVLPTGTGKTWIAAHLHRAISTWKNGRPRGRTLFLVHRDNLVTQAADTYRKWCPERTVGIEKGGGQFAGNADVVVASVQSLGQGKYDEGMERWEYGDRLRSFRPEQFDDIVCDESHHAVQGKHYHNVFRYFGVLKGDREDPGTMLLCITATPNRSDNLGMEAICDKIVYEYPLRQGITEGYLSDLRGFRVETEVDISGVHTTHGDFNVSELEHTVNTKERNELVAREYLKVREQSKGDVESHVGRKPYGVAVDFVDVSGKHSLITISSLFGLRAKFDAKGGSLQQQAQEVESLRESNPGLYLEDCNDMEAVKRRLESVKTSLHKLDLLAPPQCPEEMRNLSRLIWLKETEGCYHLGLLNNTMLSIRENGLGQCDVYRHVKGIRTKLYVAKDIKEAVALAEKEVPAEDRRAMAADASWRLESCTEKQARLLWTLDRKLKREFKTPDELYRFSLGRFKSGDINYSRGTMSNRISALQSART